jgi:hypothetical protein
MLDIDGHDLVDTAAALFVIVTTVIGLLVSTRISALTTTFGFLIGRQVSDSELAEVRSSLVTACVFSLASGVVFSLLSFASVVPVVNDKPEFLGTGLLNSSLGLLYGAVVVLVLLPAVFTMQRRMLTK